MRRGLLAEVRGDGLGILGGDGALRYACCSALDIFVSK